MLSSFAVVRSSDNVPIRSGPLFNDMCELLQATMLVITVRTTRMVTAGAFPDDCDQREFTLMSVEKGEAATESILALASGWINLTRILTRDINDHLWATSGAAAMLVSSRSNAQWFEHQTTLWKLAAEFPANPAQLASLSTNLMQEILAPIRNRALANAKRLGAP